LGLVSGQTRNEIEELQKAGRGEEAGLLLQENLKNTEGAMEGLAGTFNGKVSTLADNWRLFTADFIEESGVFDLAKNSVEALIDSIGFLTSKDLEGEFDDILGGMSEIDNVIKEQEKTKEAAFAAEQKRIAAEAKARSDAIRNQKLAIDNEKKLKEQRKAEELKELELEAKELEDFEREKAKFAEEQANQLLDLQEKVTLENRERKLNEFAFQREQELIEHELRLATLAGFNEDIRMQEEIHKANMTDIAKREADAIDKLEKQKRQSQLDTFNVYAQVGQNMIGTMQEVFGKNKVFAAAMITAQGAQAVVNALATPPFPLGISLAALATAKTVSSLSKLSSAKAFALGGVVGGGEQMIRVNEQGNEAVLNASATRSLGRETIDLINNGRSDMIGSPSSNKPQINISVNGVLSQEVFENEIRPYMEQEMAYR
jgi:hypothetical protein